MKQKTCFQCVYEYQLSPHLCFKLYFLMAVRNLCDERIVEIVAISRGFVENDSSRREWRPFHPDK